MTRDYDVIAGQRRRASRRSRLCRKIACDRADDGDRGSRGPDGSATPSADPRSSAASSFSLDADDFCAVIGPSGAGKSTLIRCINRLVEPTGGRDHPVRRGRPAVCDAATAAAAPAHRHDLPGVQPGEPAVGDGQRAVRPARLHRHRAQPVPGCSRGRTSSGRCTCSTASACPTTSTSAPTRSPAASASASASRAR